MNMFTTKTYAIFLDNQIAFNLIRTWPNLPLSRLLLKVKNLKYPTVTEDIRLELVRIAEMIPTNINSTSFEPLKFFSYNSQIPPAHTFSR